MTDKDLEKSITLIGPSCVGKSLIASELSKKLKMDYVCIDDLLVMIEYERDGILSPDPKIQKRYVKMCVEDMLNDPQLEHYMANPKLRRKQLSLIRDFVDLYNYFLRLFGSLKPFYDILTRYQNRIVLTGTEIERLTNLNIVSAEMVAKIMQLVNCPIILDSPASFGWKSQDVDHNIQLMRGELIRSKDVNFKITQKFIDGYLNATTTVLLCPGIDYKKRNAAKNSRENKVLLEHIGNYYDNADISITTNGVFNQPENKYLQRRSWLDAKESLTKEKLKNKAEINNICDEIITRMEELNSVNSL